MKLINSIISISIILFFAALIYVGYKSINYYNANAGNQISLSDTVSESAGEALAEAKDFGEKVEKGMEETTKAILGEKEEKHAEDELSEEEDNMDEASDESLEEEKDVAEEASVEEVKKEKEKESVKLIEKRPENYDAPAEKTEKKSAPRIPGMAKIPPRNYMVIAGSFSTRKNAKIEQTRLKKLGYHPEIVQFKGAKLHTLVAARTFDSARAKAVVKRLKSQGIEAFTRKKKTK